MIDEHYKGAFCKITHCTGATQSLAEALKSVTAKKARSMTTQLILQIERMAAGERMSNLTVRKEGLLPSYQGKPAKHFYALKRIPIRGYYWESESKDQVSFISHYIYKDFDDLHSSDTTRVCNNWHRIENNGDDC